MNFIKRIFGKKEEQPEVISRDEIKNEIYTDLRLVYDFKLRYKHFMMSTKLISKSSSRLQPLSIGGELELIRVVDSCRFTYFVIVRHCPDLDIHFPIQSFRDEDEEYAENCAREAFDYLTKEI